MADQSAYQSPSQVEELGLDRALFHLRVSAVMPKTRAIVPRTPQEWNAHRDLITKLYRDMELPLKEVQHIMEVHHHFKAT